MRCNVDYENGFTSIELGKNEGKVFDWQPEFSNSAKKEDFIICDGKMNPLFLVSENTPENNITKIEYWAPQLVQDFCIENHMYTCGTVEEYNQMFDYIRSNDPTTGNLYAVAKNILEHSNDEVNNNFTVGDVMGMLYKKTVTLDYITD